VSQQDKEKKRYIKVLRSLANKGENRRPVDNLTTRHLVAGFVVLGGGMEPEYVCPECFSEVEECRPFGKSQLYLGERTRTRGGATTVGEPVFICTNPDCSCATRKSDLRVGGLDRKSQAAGE
jgi:hypothetical protein